MRLEIKINQYDKEKASVLVVLLFTNPEEYYMEGGEDGIYNCCSTLPDDRLGLLSVIENSINACFRTFEENMESFINNLINKCNPKIDEFLKIGGIK